jgi:hypothetical protein
MVRSLGCSCIDGLARHSARGLRFSSTRGMRERRPDRAAAPGRRPGGSLSETAALRGQRHWAEERWRRNPGVQTYRSRQAKWESATARLARWRSCASPDGACRVPSDRIARGEHLTDESWFTVWCFLTARSRCRCCRLLLAARLTAWREARRARSSVRRGSERSPRWLR